MALRKQKLAHQIVFWVKVAWNCKRKENYANHFENVECRARWSMLWTVNMTKSCDITLNQGAFWGNTFRWWFQPVLMLNRKSVIESDSFPNYKFSKYNTKFEKYIDLCNEKKYRCSAVLGNEPIPKRLLQRYGTMKSLMSNSCANPPQITV